MLENQAAGIARLKRDVVMARGIGENPLVALTPAMVEMLVAMATDESTSDIDKTIVDEVLADIFGETTRRAEGAATLVCLDGLDTPLDLAPAERSTCIMVGLIATLHFTSADLPSSARDLKDKYNRDGKPPATPSEDGRLLLTELPHVPQRSKLDFWEVLELAVAGAVFRHLISVCPTLTDNLEVPSVQLSPGIRLPMPSQRPVDWLSVELRLNRWLHLKRRGTHLPFPFIADDLSAALMTGTCPPSLARRIHDAAIREIKSCGDVGVVYLFPELVVDMLKVATASLSGWVAVHDYYRYWHDSEEGYIEYVYQAVKGSLWPLTGPPGRPYNIHIGGLNLEAIHGQPRFLELRKIIYAASVEDHSPIDSWHLEMPEWAQSVLLFGVGLSWLFKNPSRRATKVGRPPIQTGPGLFTIKEAAVAAKTSASTIRRWISDGVIPRPARIPAGQDKSRWQIVFTREELDDLTLLAMENGDIATKLGVTDRTVRRRVVALGKAHPGASKLELRKKLLA